MAVTRLWQAGAELQHVNELTVSSGIGGSDSPIISSTKAKTGTYSFIVGGQSYPSGKSITSTTQIRAGCFINHNGNLSTASRSGILGVYSSLATPFCRVQWNGNTNVLELIVNNSSVATINDATAGFTTTNTWYHCGITYKAHASTGFFSFYLDGVQKLTWTGNTGTAITGVYMGGGLGSGSSGFAATAYFDDFYVDDTVGEADAAPPSPRFPFLLVNGAGNYTNWSVNTGTNSAAVDDSGAPDDDTTYVYATASGVKDSYALTNTTAGVTVPAGYSIEAVIPVAWARKTDAGTASTLKLGTRLSATDSVGSAQTLATSYGPVMERQTTKPGGGAWTESDIDSAEFYQESAGSY